MGFDHARVHGTFKHTKRRAATIRVQERALAMNTLGSGHGYFVDHGFARLKAAVAWDAIDGVQCANHFALGGVFFLLRRTVPESGFTATVELAIPTSQR